MYSYNAIKKYPRNHNSKVISGKYYNNIFNTDVSFKRKEKIREYKLTFLENVI